MGMYLYKVTGKIVKDDQGRKANLLKYAYKPYHSWGADAENAKMHFTSGAARAEHYAENSPNFTGRVVMEANGPSLVYGYGTISDDYFDARVHEEKEKAA